MLDSMCILDKILYLLLTQSMLTRASLLTLAYSNTVVYDAINIALARRYISEGYVTYIVRGKKQKLSYYAITATGISYLKNKCGESVPWLSHLESSKRITVRGANQKPEQVERFVRMSNTAAMMTGIGAVVPMSFLASTESNTLEAIVTSALAETKSQRQNRNSNHSIADSLYFYSASNMKRSFGSADNVHDTSDYDFGRYTGMVESCSKSVLLYAASSAGMAWPYKVVMKEVNAFKLFSHTSTIYNTVRYADQRGGTFVKNARGFGELYHDTKNRRKAGEHLGNFFTNFYIIPATYAGLQNFDSVMRTDENSHIEFLADAVASGIYTHNNSNDTELFPLKNTNGNMMMVGTAMDVIQMQRLEVTLKHRPDLDCGILCYLWQIEYYRKVFPKLKYMTLELGDRL